MQHVKGSSIHNTYICEVIHPLATPAHRSQYGLIKVLGVSKAKVKGNGVRCIRDFTCVFSGVQVKIAALLVTEK